MQISKLTAGKKRVEKLLRKEKVENRAHEVQIKKIQVDILVENIPRDRGVSTQRKLKDKEGTIQLLKKYLDIPATRLIQTSELRKIWKEKEALNIDLINGKARLLKHEEKEK